MKQLQVNKNRRAVEQRAIFGDGQEPCFICGRPLNIADAYMVRVIDGCDGNLYVTNLYPPISTKKRPLIDLGGFYVGAACARKKGVMAYATRIGGP